MTVQAQLAATPRSLATIGAALRSSELTCAEVVEEALTEVDRLQPLLNAFSHVSSGSARAEAVRLDQETAAGHDRGPLHGITFAVKDLIAVAGTPLRAGSSVYCRHPRRDARIVAQFRDAGAVSVGLTRLHEIALGPTGLNPHDGGARNPHDPGRIPGGSSSGSAVAVAAGLVPLALGTDTGGSVRIPAALCGIAGFKPTYRLLSTAGVMPLAPTLDHVGLFAYSSSDIQLALGALGAIAPVPRPSLRGLRMGVLRSGTVDLERAVQNAFDGCIHALEDAGVDLVDVDIESPSLVMEVSSTIMFREAFESHVSVFSRDPHAFGSDIRQRLRDGEAIDAATYAAALQEQKRLIAATESLLQQIPFVISPTVPVEALEISETASPSRRGLLPRNTRFFNLVGVPAVSIPAPVEKLPVGLQIAARRGSDASLLAVATAVEDALRTKREATRPFESLRQGGSDAKA